MIVSAGPACGASTVDDLVRLLSDLVAIPSVNPMGREASPGPSSSSRG